jgi:dipeptidyl aminopeptidase/acylaminoacyl peptidase
MAQAPVFSARGDAIYFGARDGVRRLDLASGRETVVIAADASGGVAIAPDRRHLAYSSCAPRARIIDVLARPEAPVVDDPDARSPAVGPRGLLAWARVTAAGRVLMVRSGDGAIRQLTSAALGDIVDPVVDPEGRHIAFEVIGPQPGVYVASIDPSQSLVTRVTDRKGDGRPAWFDSGKLVFRRTDDAGIGHAYVIGLDGGEPTVLPGRSKAPYAAHPVTHEILVGGSGASSLSWWSTTQGRERPGPRGAPPSMQSASISPNGRWLLVQSGVAGNVMWRAALPDGELEKIHEEKGGRAFGQAVIDDDGRVIAAPVEWRGELAVVEVEAGSL